MENPCKIVFFGDSITAACFPYLKEVISERLGSNGIELVNHGVNGEDAGDGVGRLKRVIDDRPDVVILGFGMNDFLNGTPLEKFRQNTETIVSMLQGEGARVIVNTVNPICSPDGEKEDTRLAPYNEILFELARKFALVVNDVGAYWKRELDAIQAALVYEGCDYIHPNHIGYRLIAQRLAVLIPRSITRIVWQFNGANAECNYAARIAISRPITTMGTTLLGMRKTWRFAFRKAFGIRRLNFYLSFGEPCLANAFYEVVRMIESEPRWKVVILTNLSQDLKPLYEMKITHEGRLFVVASFHPSMVRLNAFIDKILQARRYGVEIPVVYVMWPPQIRISKSGISLLFRRIVFWFTYEDSGGHTRAKPTPGIIHGSR